MCHTQEIKRNRKEVSTQLKMPSYYIKAKSQTVLQICSTYLHKHVQIDQDISISQPALEENTIDTKQQEICKCFREYNSTVFNTPILHITIFLHIRNLLMQHLQGTYIYLQKVNMSVSSGFLPVRWKKSQSFDRASHLCQSFLTPVKCWIISM